MTPSVPAAETPEPPDEPARLTRGGARLLACALVALSLPAFAAPAVGAATTALYSAVDPAHPYFSFARPALLYLGVPATVFAAIVLVLSPGLLLALAFGRARSPSEWTLAGFAISTIVVSVAAAAVQSFSGTPLTGAGFVATTLGCTAASWLVLDVRTARGAAPSRPVARRDAVRFAALSAAVPIALLVALTPKVFWESFNGDGAHAFEATRLLLRQPVPFWPVAAGNVAAFPGVNTVLFTYPTSWFIRLFGETEAGARLPFFLFLIALHAGVLAVVSGEPRRRLSVAAHALVWASLVAYSLVMCFSATYDPYCSDIALPAGQDTLLVVCFLGVVVGCLRRDWIWTGLFALLTLTTSPAGALLLGAWGVGVLVSRRPAPWRDLLVYAGVVAACFVFIALLPRINALLRLPLPGSEHGADSLLRKYAYLQFLDVQRWAFLIVPTGIYPALGLLKWRGADDAGRALIVTTAFAFGAYYVLAIASLHYFVPAMLLPLVVFWRSARPEDWKAPRAALAACSAAAAVAIWLALPAHVSIYTATRDVGRRIDVAGVPGYAASAPEPFAASDVLARSLFPVDAAEDVPEKAYGGSPLAWNYYARRPDADGGAKDYWLRRADAPAPAGGTLLMTDHAYSIYLRDADTWEADRALHPAGSSGGSLFSIPRDILFRRDSSLRRAGVIDLRRLLGRKRQDD